MNRERAYFLPFFSCLVSFFVSIVPVVAVVPVAAVSVEVMPVPVVPVAAVSVEVMPVPVVAVAAVSVVDIVPVVPVAAVSLAGAELETDVSVVAVSVFVFSSFLQLTANRATAKSAIRVITRDFFIS